MHVDAQTARKVFNKAGHTGFALAAISREVLPTSQFNGDRLITAAVQKITGAKPIDGLYGPISEVAVEDYLELDEWRSQVASTNVRPTQFPAYSNIEQFYGEPGESWVRMRLPFSMRVAWDLSVVVNSFSIHEKCKESAEQAFELIAAEYNRSDRQELGIDLFGGCGNVRRMRGGTKMSTHSWACAIDFDPARNRLKWRSNRARLAQPDAVKFWEIWESVGWVSLGRTQDRDWMHVQAVR